MAEGPLTAARDQHRAGDPESARGAPGVLIASLLYSEARASVPTYVPLPILRKMAAIEGQDALAQIDKQYEVTMKLVPA